MSFWSIMNWVAWALCGLIGSLILTDFVKVEKEMAKSKNESKIIELSLKGDV